MSGTAETAQLPPGTMTRAQFDVLPVADKPNAARTMKIVDTPAPPAARHRISDAAFAKMPATGRDEWRRRGGLVGAEPETLKVPSIDGRDNGNA